MLIHLFVNKQNNLKHWDIRLILVATLTSVNSAVRQWPGHTLHNRDWATEEMPLHVEVSGTSSSHDS